MKKLESLKDEKFDMTPNELLQIRGGYGTGTNLWSYVRRDTSNGADVVVENDWSGD
jgi:hypothetical protein